MKLKEWRNRRRLTLNDLAVALGIAYARNYQRYEAGMVAPDAPLVERISLLTNGEVGPLDHHNQRLEWLRDNRPDLLSEIDVVGTLPQKLEAAE